MRLPDSSSAPVPSTEGAAPDSGETFVPERKVAVQIAQIAGARAHGWRLCGELLAAPTPELVERLRSGELLEELSTSIAWLGEEAGRFLPSQMALDTFARRSRRRTAEQDLTDLSAEHARLWPEGAPWLDTYAALAASADEEADAWGRGDHTRAKELRVAQQHRIEDELVDELPSWAGGVDTSTTLMLYRTAVRFAVAHLSFESGRDFDAVVFGGSPLVRDPGQDL